jgi:Sister chromatid cohesion protein Dcc1
MSFEGGLDCSQASRYEFMKLLDSLPIIEWQGALRLLDDNYMKSILDTLFASINTYDTIQDISTIPSHLLDSILASLEKEFMFPRNALNAILKLFQDPFSSNEINFAFNKKSIARFYGQIYLKQHQVLYTSIHICFVCKIYLCRKF